MDYFNNRMNFMNPINPMQNISGMSNSCPFIYVSSLEEAKNYPVVPNNTCILFLNDFSGFFIKKVDSMGIPEISMFKAERVPIETSPVQADTKSVEIDELKREISELKSLICQKVTTKEANDDFKLTPDDSAVQSVQTANKG